MPYAKLIGRIALFTCENIAHIEFYLQGLLPKILAIYTIKFFIVLHVQFIECPVCNFSTVQHNAKALQLIFCWFLIFYVSSITNNTLESFPWLVIFLEI